MPIITLESFIKAPVQVCFDLSRNIDLHARSMHRSSEKAIAGTVSGLIGLNETVTWQAKHFGISFLLTTKITALEAPRLFIDEQVSGPFRSLKHTHHFTPAQNGTMMVDVFEFHSPFGWIGRFVDWLFLERYMRQLLLKRNWWLQQEAETFETV